MRRTEALLMDMLLAARKIQRFSSDLDQAAFENSELIQSAVLREFQVVGEAARMISEEAKMQIPEIPWMLIAGMRNRMIHEYFKIDLEIVWATIQKNIPDLISALEVVVPADEEPPPTD